MTTVAWAGSYLALNDGPNHLNGGARKSFDKVVWKAEPFTDKTGEGVRLSYTSPHGEEGYPGTLKVSIIYHLVTGTPKGRQLTITYEATTDKTTPVNVTNHSYFNLAAAGSPSVLDHTLLLHANKYTPLDSTLIPTGKIDAVPPPLNFSFPCDIGSRVKMSKTKPKGIDEYYVLKPTVGPGGVPVGPMKLAAELFCQKSGRKLLINTTQLGIHVDTGNALFGQKGSGGKSYTQHSAVCLAPQHFPDAMHHKGFPSMNLEPGETYRHITEWRFIVFGGF